MQELEMMALLDHNNIVQIVDGYEDKKRLAIVMEMYPLSLSPYLKIYRSNKEKICSVFKSDLDLYKSGLITIEQYLKKTREIAELTGKNPKQWLGLLSSRFKDPIAEVLIKTV